MIKAHIDSINKDIITILARTKLLLDAQSKNVELISIPITEYTQTDVNYRCMNCQICRKTCHSNCNAIWKGVCAVMDKNNNCTVCGCAKISHKFYKQLWDWTVKIEIAESKESISFADYNNNINELTKPLEAAESELYGKIGSIIIFIDEFNKIALKPTQYTIKKYIDTLIDNECKNGGNKQVIQYLKNLKKENVINAIKKYSNEIKNTGVKFADLNYIELQRHYKNIRNVVKKEMNE